MTQRVHGKGGKGRNRGIRQDDVAFFPSGEGYSEGVRNPTK